MTIGEIAEMLPQPSLPEIFRAMQKRLYTTGNEEKGTRRSDHNQACHGVHCNHDTGGWDFPPKSGILVNGAEDRSKKAKKLAKDSYEKEVINEDTNNSDHHDNKKFDDRY